MLVFVLNKHGKPLMPCKPRKARILLKEGKAEAVKKTPFTIQLKFGSSGYKQDIKLGVDSGFNHIGLSAVTEKQKAKDCILLESAKTILTEKRRAAIPPLS